MLPKQRWQIAPASPEAAYRLAEQFQISPLLAQVMLNRGLTSQEAAAHFLAPQTWMLPDPIDEFPDLAKALDRLATAIENRVQIAICGDYDCDGMTSTALLLRAVRSMGGKIEYAIPSRMHEGYGINRRIVEEFHDQGVGLILTVDNGISAYEPIARAVELGMSVIITDHHDLPEKLPPADAILNPKLIAQESPYRSLAGVGVAYVLANALAQHFGRTADLADSLLEMYTLGTVADLAPLVGVNRVWVTQGLACLPKSQNPGIRALIQASGQGDRADLKPEAIGFGLGPRINAIGRIADPQIVIELLTTDDDAVAAERAAQCELYNAERQEFCRTIEEEAVQLVEAAIASGDLDLLEERVLLVGKEDWHHGVIGIVASRLKERYGAPVFIYAVEDGKVRGSARGIPEFHIYEALHHCESLFQGFGGHPMAGGFAMKAENLPALRVGLREFARIHLSAEQIAPLIEIDAYATFAELDLKMLRELDRLQPCGLGNSEPVFWTANVKVITQKAMGKTGSHLNLNLDDGTATRRGVAWRVAEWLPLPEYIDVAYTLKANTWKGRISAELEIVGIRPAAPAPLEIPMPRPWENLVTWHDCHSDDAFTTLKNLVSTQVPSSILLYGHDAPSGLPVHYNRPQGQNVYAHLVLWTLPPSPLHLQWLLSVAKPQHVYLMGQPVPEMHPWTLRDHLRGIYNPTEPIRVLLLCQQQWVSPRALLDGLQDLGYVPHWPNLVKEEVHSLLGVPLLALPDWYRSESKDLAPLLVLRLT
jgi:single-stranded-DNA-specific exonuclease